GFIRWGVMESQRWKDRIDEVGHDWNMQKAFAALFSRRFRRRTLLNSIYLLISIVGLWACSVYVPASVSQIAIRSGFSERAATRLASYGTMLLATGTIAGCIVLPAIAERLGRRFTLGIYFSLMAIFIWLAFGYSFYLQMNALTVFMTCLF